MCFLVLVWWVIGILLLLFVLLVAIGREPCLEDVLWLVEEDVTATIIFF